MAINNIRTVNSNAADITDNCKVYPLSRTL